MRKPISCGDVCLVVGGLGQHKSPNVGNTVIVGMCMGEHSKLGRVFRCSGEGIKQYNEDGTYQVTNWADFPTAWLQKIDPIRGLHHEQEADCHLS